jgi:hypothetical protein
MSQDFADDIQANAEKQYDKINLLREAYKSLIDTEAEYRSLSVKSNDSGNLELLDND